MSELDAIRAQRAALDARIASLGEDQSARAHEDAIEQLRQRFEQRFTAIVGARSAAAALQRISSPTEMLMQVPSSLAAATGFRRILLSSIDEATLVPVAAHFETGAGEQADADLVAEALTRLRESPVRLTHDRIESDVIRRRRATLVATAHGNARVDPRFRETMGWGSYVAAPLRSGPRVIGLLHADLGNGVRLDALDRDVLGEFAAVLSRVHERAHLRRVLLQEREAVRRFLERLNSVSISLAEAPATLSGQITEVRPSDAAMSVAPGSGERVTDDRLVISGLLTRRELDVLRLLADGSTNRTIADTLVVADTTVKFHVNSILRKLHVSNRAEAVARYLTLLGMPSVQ